MGRALLTGLTCLRQREVALNFAVAGGVLSLPLIVSENIGSVQQPTETCQHDLLCANGRKRTQGS
jgi:hypothetical protein